MKLKIVAGKYKGLNFDTVNGKNVRPTTNMMREALFSSLYSVYGNLKNANVLDCFCGSGALSFESLSRGANYSYLFEKDYHTWKIIKKNINQLNLSEKCNLINHDVLTFDFTKLKDIRFNIVFLDPPYKLNYELILTLLSNLCNVNLLEQNAVIIYEHSLDFDIDNHKKKFIDLGFKYIKTKKHSSSKCDFFIYKKGEVYG